MTYFSTDRPIRLLLVNPALPESFWSFRWWIDMLPRKRAINLPLGLATLAGLCPFHWHVTIIDENIQSLPLEPKADLIGVCGMGTQFKRQREILRYYRSHGYPTVAGGSFASLCSEDYAELADFVVAGEAEYIWPAFCRDFEAGVPHPLYRETGQVDLHDSPIPRYDLLDLDAYTAVSMQFSRGCPYRCEFCDIIVMFGRRPRTKTPEQIGRELDLLRARSVSSVFFVDDNLIGNKKEAKRLLRYLVDYQQRHDYQFSFSTEVSLNLADDTELLELFRVANFDFVFIGIESPDEASLKETGKTQNLRRDMLGAVHTIYSHGIDVLAGFIVGFDNDTPETFERQYRFITDSGIQVAMVGLLTALPHTPLYERLQQEGRLLPGKLQGDNTKPATNILPKRMEYDDMVRRYETLFRRLFRPTAIAQRIAVKMRHLRQPVPMAQFSRREQTRIAWRLLVRGILPGGPVRLYSFVRTLAVASPTAWPKVITDWIAGLAMRDYVRRHFGTDPIRAERLVSKTADWLRQRCATSLREGLPGVTAVLQHSRTELELILRGHMGRIISDRAVRRLERMLRCSAATLSLRIEEVRADQRDQVRKLLRRLEPYGQRVSIRVHQGIRHLLPVDSSTFHLVLVQKWGQVLCHAFQDSTLFNMARPLRIEFAGALYHVTSRGNGREDIYAGEDDREVWLENLGQVCERFNWTIHGYCQMGNHYHLLAETPDGNLAKGMRQLNGVYTQRFNQAHNRVGHVFQGRYKAILVQKEAYLLELARYVVLNPVRARMVRTARDWAWSSYRATAGMASAPEWLDSEWILAAFAAHAQEAQSAYCRFVANGKNQPSPWEDLKNQIYLGSEAFVDDMQRKIGTDRHLSEIPITQRRPVARPLTWYFQKHPDRDRAVFEAFRSGGYSMREIGDHLKLHYSTISRIVSFHANERDKAKRCVFLTRV